MHALARTLARTELITRTGNIVAVRGGIAEASGPASQVGEQCLIESERAGRGIVAEVLGFSAGTTVLMPLDGSEGICIGDRVVATGRLPEIPIGRELLGRVVNAFGRTVDGGKALALQEHRGLYAQPPPALERRRITDPLETGVRVIDSMLTLAKGQRIGLFAGSGVGKSSLLGMIARGARADVNVIALVGERSREVREFVEDHLGVEGMRRSVVVVATAAESAVMRVKAAYAATTIAEYFRDAGADVLLMMDSLTRFAMARREIGLNVGEPPTARGYTPSVFSELPQLCERSGPGVGQGSITGVYTVLVDGDDLNEPVSDALRATLDGHIVLSRETANSGCYPAVDVLNSVSRVHASVASPEDLAASRRVIACCALYERNRQLIEVGAYKPGVSHELDRVLEAMPKIRKFFAQATETRAQRRESLAELRRLAALLGEADANQ